MQGKKVWVLEDEPWFQGHYREIFERIGVDYALVNNLQEWTKLIHSNVQRPELVIMDIHLPDGSLKDFVLSDSFEKIRPYKWLVVSSDDDLEKLKFFLEKGAVDFILKPFNHDRLVVKITSLLNQLKSVSLDSFFAEDFLNELTFKEYQILRLFFMSNALVISISDLYEKVWQGQQVSEQTIYVHLSNLRKKLQNTGYHLEKDDKYCWKLEEVSK
jgi:DNA-binding response OmpR family regulator